ncbi:MAG: glycosyltransferase family 2 protein [Verrucomicrobiales bacterium]|jgi:glycosyltransferase involved in cell wall biosynthesis|nr:glycosyltransferase family 2 protein [Verrucomicrobiales bacterium]
MPRISTLIPVHNNAAYIGEALDSLLAQNYTDLEIIIVDDGSTDHLREMLRAYPQVSYFHQEHRGISTARNLCLEKAGGEYLAFLDADDRWLPGKLNAQLDYLDAHPDCEIIFTGYSNFLQDNSLEKLPRVQFELGIEKTNPFYLPTALAKRAVFEKSGGFNEQLQIGEDIEILLKMKLAGTKIKHRLDQVYYQRRLHGKNITLTHQVSPRFSHKHIFMDNIRKNLQQKLQPLVSVMIPAYNCAAYITKALDSILAQDHANLEIIVVDDGSTDNLQEVLQAYPQVSYLHQQNSGPSSARNLAISKAKGEYLAFLDADDYWLPGKLAAQLRYLTEHPGCQIVFTAYKNFLEDESLRDSPQVQYEIGLEQTNKFYLPTALIHRDLFAVSGTFNEQLTHEKINMAEDTDLLLRMQFSGIDIKHRLDEIFYQRRLHGNNSVLSGPTPAEFALKNIFARNMREKLRPKPPLVSVMIPTYNCAAYIKQAVDSVLAQNHPNLEIIVVDDGSTDNTREILQAYPAVKYFFQEHQGIPASRNLCLEKASGEYLAFVDADDYWLPGKLDVQLKHLAEHPECKMIFVKYQNFLSDEKLRQHEGIQHEFVAEAKNYTLMSTSLIRKSVFADYGNFSRDFPVGEDADLICRISTHDKQAINYLDQVYYMRRLHGENSVLLHNARSRELHKKILLRNFRASVKNTYQQPIAISVVIPAKNAAKYLQETLDSVRAQDFKEPVQVIVVDDGSTDDTAAIAEKSGCKVLRIPASGAPKARNTGLRQADGEFIFLLDADDLITSDALSLLKREFEKDQQLRAVFARRQNFISPDCASRDDTETGEPQFGGIAGCALIRKELFDLVGYFDEAQQAGDAIAWQLKLQNLGVKTGRILDVVAKRRLHDNNFSRVHRQQEYQDYASLLRKQLLAGKKGNGFSGTTR